MSGFKDRNHSRSQKGQISIMIAVMMSTFLLFFAFVVNIGMLVNAKINLQNAADLAAYAGAAVQARQLTQISYLNYEMRRQWKKFLFRTYVIANMAQDSFPQAPGTGPMRFSPDNRNDYGAPTTCIIFNNNDNYCHLSALPGISMPSVTGLDAITDTLVGQLQQLENIRQLNCKNIGMTNLMLNMYWLYNTDPTLSNLSSLNAMDAQQQNTLKVVQGLAYGLGIVPRELILKFRINTLASYVNAQVQTGLTKGTVDGFLNVPDTGSYERSVQAFYSAYYTLGNHTFSGNSIILDELLPGDSSSAQLLFLKPIMQAIDTFAIDFDIGGGGVGGSAGSSSASCDAKSVPISLQQPLTLGVYKDPSILTYYAVRLKAKARVLFSPFGDIEMKAYAAAQPFGSRIGPNDSAVQFAARRGNPTNLAGGTGMNLTGFIPNLAVKISDSAAVGSGWDTKEIVGTMYQKMVTRGNNAGGATLVTSQDMEKAYQYAMAPNPWEGTRYNIINDTGNDPFVKNFDTNMLAAFWAPVFPSDKMAALTATLKSEVDAFFDNSAQGNLGSGQNSRNKIRQALQTGLQNYISTNLQQGTGEDGEGTNIVRIRNPFVERMPPYQPMSGDPNIFMTDSKLFKTSWNDVNNSNFQQEGRVGYSVKFVSFDSLTKNKVTTDGAANWSNSLPMDTDASQDIPFLSH